jgi:hypothetical protein
MNEFSPKISQILTPVSILTVGKNSPLLNFFSNLENQKGVRPIQLNKKYFLCDKSGSLNRYLYLNFSIDDKTGERLVMLINGANGLVINTFTSGEMLSDFLNRKYGVTDILEDSNHTKVEKEVVQEEVLELSESEKRMSLNLLPVHVRDKIDLLNYRTKNTSLSKEELEDVFREIKVLEELYVMTNSFLRTRVNAEKINQIEAKIEQDIFGSENGKPDLDKEISRISRIILPQKTEVNVLEKAAYYRVLRKLEKINIANKTLERRKLSEQLRRSIEAKKEEDKIIMEKRRKLVKNERLAKSEDRLFKRHFSRILGIWQSINIEKLSKGQDFLDLSEIDETFLEEVKKKMRASYIAFTKDGNSPDNNSGLRVAFYYSIRKFLDENRSKLIEGGHNYGIIERDEKKTH